MAKQTWNWWRESLSDMVKENTLIQTEFNDFLLINWYVQWYSSHSSQESLLETQSSIIILIHEEEVNKLLSDPLRALLRLCLSLQQTLPLDQSQLLLLLYRKRENLAHSLKHLCLHLLRRLLVQVVHQELVNNASIHLVLLLLLLLLELLQELLGVLAHLLPLQLWLL